MRRTYIAVVLGILLVMVDRNPSRGDPASVFGLLLGRIHVSF